MSKKRFLIIDIFMILYVLACPFIMQISKGITQYENYVYYYFKAADQTQIAITILSIAFLLLYGLVCGFNKKFNKIAILIGICLILKISVFLSDIISPSVSELIWTVYRAPVYWISEQIDIFIFAFYEAIFAVGFALGFLAKKFFSKRIQRN